MEEESLKEAYNFKARREKMMRVFFKIFFFFFEFNFVFY